MSVEAAQRVSVKEHFDQCLQQYESTILNGTEDSTNASLQERIRRILSDLSVMWYRFEAAGALSINDELDDLTTTTLSMLITPYVVADLHQRLLTANPTTMTSEQLASSPHVSSSSASSSSMQQQQPSPPSSRAKALTLSMHYFGIFFELMVQLGLLEEKERDIGTRYHPNDRMRRIENSRRMTELRNRISEIDHRLGFLAARSKRMAQLCSEDGEAYEERNGGEEDELLRERALTRLRWAICDSFQQIQMSLRELQMLEAIGDDQKRSIAADYQRGLEEARRSGGAGVGRDTYTILPGGVIVTGVPAGQQQGGTLAGLVNTAATFREQIRQEVFMERNQPTMTLQEFAEQEMAEIDRQMKAQAEGQRLQQEEDARLGEEGIEERQRQYDSKWDDWKDDNPPIGISTKGNYS